jgi:SAM-dependent methyltransferase
LKCGVKLRTGDGFSQKNNNVKQSGEHDVELSKAVELIKHTGLGVNHITTWADLGCGDGFFTKALSAFLKEGSIIYAVDTNAAALKKVKPIAGITVKPLLLNFVDGNWPFDELDGIIMANSLHYVKHAVSLLEKAKRHLKHNGSLLIVEYDTDMANPWVPYPLSYNTLQRVCLQAGFATVQKLGQTPSAFGRANMYAAVAGM